MNSAQRKVVMIGAAVVVAMLLFPPWMRPAAAGVYVGSGYAPLWARPDSIARVDASTLALQWFAVAVATGAAFFFVTVKQSEMRMVDEAVPRAKIVAMNTRQKLALWIGVLVAVAMFLYPPWQTRGNGNESRGDGYALLFVGPVDDSAAEAWERQREELLGETGSTQEPEPEREPFKFSFDEQRRAELLELTWGERPEPRRLINSDLNYRRLLAQWLLVAIVTGAAVLTFRNGAGK